MIPGQNIPTFLKQSGCTHWQLIQGEFKGKNSYPLVYSVSHNDTERVQEFETILSQLGPGRYTIFYSKDEHSTPDGKQTNNWKQNAFSATFDIEGEKRNAQVGSPFPQLTMGAIEQQVEKQVNEKIAAYDEKQSLKGEIDSLKAQLEEKKSKNPSLIDLLQHPVSGPILGQIAANLFGPSTMMRQPGMAGNFKAPTVTTQGMPTQPAAEAETIEAEYDGSFKDGNGNDQNILDLEEVQDCIFKMFSASNSDPVLFTKRLAKLAELSRQPHIVAILDSDGNN